MGKNKISYLKIQGLVMKREVIMREVVKIEDRKKKWERLQVGLEKGLEGYKIKGYQFLFLGRSMDLCR